MYEYKCFDAEDINIYNFSMAAIPKKRNVSKKKSQLAPEIQAAIDYGIDISMLEQNLKLSCTERARRHQIALNSYKNSIMQNFHER